MKPLTQAQQLLVRVASEYRENPAIWCPSGWGRMPDGSDRCLGTELHRLPGLTRELGSMCPDVALVHFGVEYGGTATAQEARQLIYAHLGVEPEPKNIWEWNDSEGRKLEQVIDMLESAAGVSVMTTSKLSAWLRAREAVSIVASVGLSTLLVPSHAARLVA